MKNRAHGFLKQVKSKTNAMKARLIIFSLLMDKRYVMISISDKFQYLTKGHHSQRKDQCLLLGDESEQKMSFVEFKDIYGQSSEAVSNPSETHVVEEDKGQGGCQSYHIYKENEDHVKYQVVLDSNDLDHGGYVVDLAKNSEDEAGQELKEDNEIDLMADLFIKKFRREIFLQQDHTL